MQKKNNTRKSVTVVTPARLTVSNVDLKARLKTIPIIGTVGDRGINLKRGAQREPSFRNGNLSTIVDTPAEKKRARREAKTVAAFLEGGPPDFLMEATLSAIDDAFDHHGLQKPRDCEGIDDYDEQNLCPLFLKTKLSSWGDFYSGEQRVSDSILELLHNPQTPADLFEAVAQFVCEQSNKADLFHSAPVIGELLKSVPPDELRGAVIEARGAN